jgi:hypothetical protein
MECALCQVVQNSGTRYEVSTLPSAGVTIVTCFYMGVTSLDTEGGAAPPYGRLIAVHKVSVRSLQGVTWSRQPGMLSPPRLCRCQWFLVIFTGLDRQGRWFLCLPLSLKEYSIQGVWKTKMIAYVTILCGF